MKLSSNQKALAILLAITLIGTIAGAIAVSYVLTLSAPQTTIITSKITGITVTLTAPATATDADQITLLATIIDPNGNGLVCTFYDNGVACGHATFVGGQASIPLGPGLSVGTHTWTAGP